LIGYGSPADSSWVAPIGCIHVLECRWARLIVLHTVAHTLKAYLCVSMQPVKDTFMPQSPTTSTDVGSASSLSKHCKLLRLVAVLCTAGFVAHAQAVPSLDASNDFLPNYAGAKDADLDVLQADVVIDPVAQTITFSGAMRGNFVDAQGPLLNLKP
jgi:hypothetical protein